MIGLPKQALDKHRKETFLRVIKIGLKQTHTRNMLQLPKKAWNKHATETCYGYQNRPEIKTDQKRVTIT